MLGSCLRRCASTAFRVATVRALSRQSGSALILSSPSARIAIAVQMRWSSVEVYGPFDPPKQLTFKEVEERVLKAIRAWDRFPADKAPLLSLDAVFSELGFDSLDHVEIMMTIEDEFAFEIPQTEADKLKTPRDIFKFICEREDVYE